MLWSGRRGSEQLDPTRPILDDLKNPKFNPHWMFGRSEGALKCFPCIMGRSFLCGDSLFEQDQHGLRMEQAEPDVGFRVVRCEKGVHPKDGLEPLVTQALIDVQPEKFNPIQSE